MRRGRRSIVAAGDDVALANQLASGALGAQPDPLLPQTRRLLQQLEEFVSRSAAQQQIARQDVRFMLRQLRETLEWQDRALRRQLTLLLHEVAAVGGDFMQQQSDWYHTCLISCWLNEQVDASGLGLIQIHGDTTFFHAVDQF